MPIFMASKAFLFSLAVTLTFLQAYACPYANKQVAEVVQEDSLSRRQLYDTCSGRYTGNWINESPGRVQNGKVIQRWNNVDFDFCKNKCASNCDCLGFKHRNSNGWFFYSSRCIHYSAGWPISGVSTLSTETCWFFCWSTPSTDKSSASFKVRVGSSIIGVPDTTPSTPTTDYNVPGIDGFDFLSPGSKFDFDSKSFPCGTVTAVGTGPQPAATIDNTTRACFISATSDYYGYTFSVLTAGTLRYTFHDCITGSCDGSLFLSSEERNADTNANVIGAYAVQPLRQSIYDRCGKWISWADVGPLGSSVGIAKLGGPDLATKVALGRADSAAPEEYKKLPKSTDNSTALVAYFKERFNTADDDAVKITVVLSGAHTIGFAACSTFKDREDGNDGLPLSSRMESVMKTRCLAFLANNYFVPSFVSGCSRLELDTSSPLNFDNSYYKNLVKNEGILSSDQTLLSSPYCSAGGVCTDALVKQYADDQQAFFDAWSEVFLRMTSR